MQKLPNPKPAKKEKENDSFTMPPSYLSLFKENTPLLSVQYTRFLSLRNQWGEKVDERSLFMKWLEYRRVWIEEDLLSGKGERNLISKLSELHTAPKEQILFQNFDYFKDHKRLKSDCLWSPRFESKPKNIILLLIFLSRQIHSESQDFPCSSSLHFDVRPVKGSF